MSWFLICSSISSSVSVVYFDLTGLGKSSIFSLSFFRDVIIDFSVGLFGLDVYSVCVFCDAADVC